MLCRAVLCCAVLTRRCAVLCLFHDAKQTEWAVTSKAIACAFTHPPTYVLRCAVLCCALLCCALLWRGAYTHALHCIGLHWSVLRAGDWSGSGWSAEKHLRYRRRMPCPALCLPPLLLRPSNQTSLCCWADLQGAAQGLGFGLNTAAFLVTRGCAEMKKLALARGSKDSTLAGLSGSLLCLA